MKFLKKHKSLIIALIVFIIVLVMFLFAYRTFFPEEETAIYGTRLEGIDKVEVSKDTLEKIEKATNEVSKKTTARVQGRVLNVIISINDDVSRDTAKETAPKIVEQLTKDQVRYYDIQVFIKKEGKTEDSGSFPIIGYKHHSSETFTWTKDR